MTYHPHMPVTVKLDVVIRQEGKCSCGCGEKLGTLKETQFDHVPALCFRKFDETTKTYDPPANDPTRIFAKRVDCHLQKTKQDISDNAKADRLERELNGLPKRKKVKKPIKSRGFEKSPDPWGKNRKPNTRQINEDMEV